MRTYSSTAVPATLKAGAYPARLSGFRRFNAPQGLLGTQPWAEFSYSVRGRIVTLTLLDGGTAFRAHLTEVLARPPRSVEVQNPSCLIGERVFLHLGFRGGVLCILAAQPP